ncbi:hypothetical protein ACF073_12935 [Streptomyces sp. NPDC015171]|uniref:hypothetical protein n=1 Tax=Streptomyces sp. NPDC015171 TaxID=3364945 RepID=UPI0036F7B0F6
MTPRRAHNSAAGLCPQDIGAARVRVAEEEVEPERLAVVWVVPVALLVGAVRFTERCPAAYEARAT